MSRHATDAAPEQPTPARPPVQLKGRGSGLRLIVAARAAPAQVEASLREQLERRGGGFFGAATVSLEMPGTQMDLALAERLQRLVEAAGLRLSSIVTAEALAKDPPRAAAEPRSAAAPPPEGALVLDGTLRGGRRVSHGGSVVVFGDVNPGAEILAGEHVVVWGRLRGLVEAGLARGEDQVDDIRVAALDLAPTQLRIGAAIARAPEEPGRVPEPETARVQGGRIVVEAWPAGRGA